MFIQQIFQKHSLCVRHYTGCCVRHYIRSTDPACMEILFQQLGDLLAHCFTTPGRPDNTVRHIALSSSIPSRSQKCWEREVLARNIPRHYLGDIPRITWDNSKKSPELHLPPSPPLPSRKMRLERADARNSIPWSAAISAWATALGATAVLGKTAKQAKLVLQPPQFFLLHYQPPRHYLHLCCLKSAPNPPISLDMPLDYCLIKNATNKNKWTINK